VTHLPLFHGTSVTPSGRLPSVLDRPDGSLTAGMSAFFISDFNCIGLRKKVRPTGSMELKQYTRIHYIDCGAHCRQ